MSGRRGRKINMYQGYLHTLFRIIVIRPLTLEEKKFLLAVERGDVANVRRFKDKFMSEIK